MKQQSNIIYLIRNLREKLRVGVRDTKTDTEIWHTYFSPLGLFLKALFSVVVLTVTFTLLLTYSSAIDLLPGFPGSHSRELLIENIMRLDSMEQQLNSIQLYGQNVALIMDGKQPIVRNNDPLVDSVARASAAVVVASREDSLLRAQIEGTGSYTLNKARQSRLKVNQEFLPPLKGTLIKSFNKKDFGITIAAINEKQIMSVDEGTVILTTWSPIDGNLIQIQHQNNIISVYKQAYSIIKKQGDRLRAGEVIGFMGEGEQEENLIFELWNAGQPVDPENYILF